VTRLLRSRCSGDIGAKGCRAKQQVVLAGSELKVFKPEIAPQ
jgi:hypothetical protein